MGSPLGSLCELEEVSLTELSGQTIAVDGNLDTYQYITAITDDWNDYVRNDEGLPISHLIGLLQRYAPVVSTGVNVVYVYDGGFPELKEEEVESRRTEGAVEAFNEAKRAGNRQKAKKLAYEKTAVTEFMRESASDVLEAMGIPVMIAAEEGEPQCAQLVKDGLVDYPVSQDWDTLLYDIPSMVREFNSGGGALAHRDHILSETGWTMEELRWYCVLRGSDYNRSVSGVGTVRGRSIVDDADSFGEVMDSAESYGYVDRDRWRAALHLFEDPVVHRKPDIPSFDPDPDALRDIAIERYGVGESLVHRVAGMVAE